MLKTLIEKELKGILQSPKFVATFSVCAILILLSIYVGIREYESAVSQYESATRLTRQEVEETSSFMGLNTRVYRRPEPMQIFVSGVHHDIGRLSGINSFNALKLTNSLYSDDPVFAVFRFVDFAFIVQIVLSLFAILFTYDAINGEREGGTLKLVFANAIPRAKYILAKFIGSWLGIIIPLLIPILLGLLTVNIFSVPMSGDDWLRVFALIGSSILFFTFFIAFGLLISTLTKQSSISFLLLLVSWVLFVLIIPRASVMAAGQLVTVPSASEIESQQDGFAKARWKKHAEDMARRWRNRNAEMEGMDKEERQAYRDDKMWEWMEEEDEERKKIQEDINNFTLKLQEDFRNRKATQEKLAFTLSRFSPASAYQLTAMNLAGTNIDLKTRNEDAMNQYRKDFIDYRDRKRKESGGGGGIRVEWNSDTGMKIDTGRDKGRLDVSDMPLFQPPQYELSDAIAPTIIDFGLLTFYTLASFAGAFVGFLRYDVR